ncbi:MAG: membrane protein insertion efficiency factor YidD [Planctomycetota bacterium]
MGQCKGLERNSGGAGILACYPADRNVCPTVLLETGRKGNGNVGTGERIQTATSTGRRRDRSFPFSLFSAFPSLLRALLIGLARLYQCTLGAALPDSCRFSPTCSEYFVRAVRKHGALRGAWLGVRRVLRCHPYHEGGRDPVP